jgi:hypothetical protein
LILEGGDCVVVVTTVCKGRGYQTDAGEQSEEYLTHRTSQE